MSVRAAFFPSLDASTNPYWAMLRKALRDSGVEFVASDDTAFRLEWLWKNRDRVHVLHFHYIQQFYTFESTHARLTWVLRFARNLLLARLLGYRTVFTLHNLRPTYPLAPTWVDYLGHWVAANLTDAVIVHCEHARAALTARFGRRRNVHVVPHPHFIDAYPNDISRDDARRLLGYGASDTVFAYIGGIRPNKGIDRLIAAFRTIQDTKLRLLIAGEPQQPDDYVGQLGQMAGPDDRIRIDLSFIPDDKLQVYFNAADAVVLPFSSILTSGSTILAMSFGRPVVVPSMGCLTELVDDEVGQLYNPRTDYALPQALARCAWLDLSRMGQAAKRRVESLSADKVATATLKAYGTECVSQCDRSVR